MVQHANCICDCISSLFEGRPHIVIFDAGGEILVHRVMHAVQRFFGGVYCRICHVFYGLTHCIILLPAGCAGTGG
jgi:hypothetical protein